MGVVADAHDARPSGEGKAADAHCLRQLKWAAGASDACTSYGFWCTEEQLMLMTGIAYAMLMPMILARFVEGKAVHSPDTHQLEERLTSSRSAAASNDKLGCCAAMQAEDRAR